MDVEVTDGGSEVEHLELEESGKSGAALLKGKGIEGVSPEKEGGRGKGVLNEKKDTKKVGVVDLEEPEVPLKRIKTLREREAEMHEGIKKIKEEGRDTMKVHTEMGISKSGGEKDGVSKEKSTAEVYVEKPREAEVMHTATAIQEEEEKKRALTRVDDNLVTSAAALIGNMVEARRRAQHDVHHEDIGELKMLLGVVDASGSGGGDAEGGEDKE
ncbi:hypothetical protein L1987_71308 [Smallanthus sonchifolius]|uniref:Uncharacterized protein n=1 Tax=Smallanthus sonchifolius TaxID=185202 RepID=A0ACB9ATP0_9ASTR|nr:hypothetical protein L1987_71308 [Smallanthus sonchifolius]